MTDNPRNQCKDIQDLFDQLIADLEPVIEEIRKFMANLKESRADFHTHRKRLAESLHPTAPVWVDTNRVAHTRTKPPKSTLPYRRRTP